MLAVLALTGCESGYEIPPTAALDGPSDLSAPGRTVISLKPFGNPVKSQVGWSDIGPGMSEALSRKLLNKGSFDVRIQTKLGESIDAALKKKGEARTEALKALGVSHPEIDFAVTGSVTDFHHTGEMSGDVGRRNWFGGKKNEAVVAIFLNIVDLRSGLVKMSDHVIGTVDAGKTPIEKQYRDLAFGSYLFWSSPLGKASNKAIDEAVDALEALVPVRAVELLATREGTSRILKVAGGKSHGLDVGNVYIVCAKPAIDGAPTPLIDPVTNDEITARITTVHDKDAEAWMLGVPSSTADTRFLVLVPQESR